MNKNLFEELSDDLIQVEGDINGVRPYAVIRVLGLVVGTYEGSTIASRSRAEEVEEWTKKKVPEIRQCITKHLQQAGYSKSERVL